jgi:hypothetical protein
MTKRPDINTISNSLTSFKGIIAFSAGIIITTATVIFTVQGYMAKVESRFELAMKPLHNNDSILIHWTKEKDLKDDIMWRSQQVRDSLIIQTVNDSALVEEVKASNKLFRDLLNDIKKNMSLTASTHLEGIQ